MLPPSFQLSLVILTIAVTSDPRRWAFASVGSESENRALRLRQDCRVRRRMRRNRPFLDEALDEVNRVLIHMVQQTAVTLPVCARVCVCVYLSVCM